MVAVLCVGLGGFIGSVGRYLLGLVPVEGDFPLMTFAVNFAGAVLIGAVFEAATEGSGLPDNAVLFLKTGVCGGFTTFSAFSLETLALLERGKYATGALYACGSVLACLAGVVIGRLAVRGVRAALTGSAAAWGGRAPRTARTPTSFDFALAERVALFRAGRVARIDGHALEAVLHALVVEVLGEEVRHGCLGRFSSLALVPAVEGQ